MLDPGQSPRDATPEDGLCGESLHAARSQFGLDKGVLGPMSAGVRKATNTLVGDDAEAKMGVGMQIACFGFAGSAALEGEAGAELVRLERFAKRIAGCHLAIEALHDQGGRARYDARLDLITRDYGLIPVEHCTDADPNAAVHRAFDSAIRLLERDSAAAR
jgi:hypothetical protein